MTTKEAIAKLYEERARRIVAAYSAGVKIEQIALDEELSAARVWGIINEAKTARAG